MDTDIYNLSDDRALEESLCGTFKGTAQLARPAIPPSQRQGILGSISGLPKGEKS